MLCLIHPTIFILTLIQNAPDFCIILDLIIATGIVMCNKCGHWTQITNDCLSGPVLNSRLFVNKRQLVRLITHLRCQCSHTSTTKTIKDNISRLSVVEDVIHNRLMWHFCMICMCHIYRIRFSFAYIRSKRLPTIIISTFIIYRTILCYKLFNKRIWTCRIIWCI